MGATTVNAQISDIKHRRDINSFEKLAASKLQLNDLSVVTLKTDKSVPYEVFNDCPSMGAFILIDRMSHQTVAAGMINHALRRATNVHRHKLDVDKESRRRLNGHTSRCLWFTGLSGSGKSTIANALEKELYQRGIRTYILDGDNLRHGLNTDLGFTDADRVENIRRVGEVARLMVDAGVMVLCCFISPFRAEREMARSLFEDGEFVEIFVDTPLDIAESRDPKGLYKKARKGLIPNFTGISSPYEVPNNPEICLDSPERPLDEQTKTILVHLNL